MSRYYSSMRFKGDGVTTVVHLTFDVREQDKLVVDFGRGVVTEGYTVDYSATPVVVKFDNPLPLGTTVTLRRRTDMVEVPHVFQETGNARGGASFNAQNIDENFDNITRGAQDAMDSQELASNTLEEMAGIRDDALEAKEGAEDAAAKARQSEDSARVSASAALTGATAASQAATKAEGHESKAKAWATNPEDIEVEGGKYSAYHWAMKAKDSVGFDIEEYRKLDDLVFNGFMQVHAQSDVGTGVFLVCPDGRVRGQMIYNNYGLQFAQVQEDGTYQTFTFPRYGEGGEIVLDKNLGYVTPEMFGAVGDGEVDDTDAVVRSILKGVELNCNIHISGTYLVRPSLNPVRQGLTGEGSFKFTTGGEWKVTNRGNHENVIYIGGSSSDSGMSPANPCSLRKAIDRIGDLGSVLEGVYVLEFTEGVHFLQGIRLTNMPYFVRYLLFRGADVPSNTKPISVLDGSKSTEPYALLGQHPQSSPYRFEFENLLVKNWFKDDKPNSGFCGLWQEATVYTRNVWFENVSFGFSVRQGMLQSLGGRAFKCRQPFNVAYNAVGYFGSLNPDHSILIEECDIGVENGRNSVMYVQNVHFKKCRIDIQCTRNSRFRSQACTHEEWGSYAYNVQLGSVHTPDNNAGSPDIFIHSDSVKPVINLGGNSTHSKMHLGTSDTNVTSVGVATVPAGTSNGLLTGFVSSGDASSFTPFRIPEFTLFTQGTTVTVEGLLMNTSGSSGEVYFTLGNPTSLISPKVRVQNTPPILNFTLTIVNQGDGTLFSYLKLGDRVGYRTIKLKDLPISLNEGEVLGRCYVSNDGRGSMEFRSISSRVVFKGG